MTKHQPATPDRWNTAKATIRLQNETGHPVKWRVWRDGRTPAQWMLQDHTGYVRALSDVWKASVPKIRLIAENHRCTFQQEID